jgi:hypothetical protein
MTRTQLIGTIAGIAALIGSLLINTNDNKPNPKPDPDPISSEVVSKAFDDYERLWIKHNHDTADLIDSGGLKTETEVWNHLATGQEAMRKVAFDTIASNEKKAFETNGGYDLKLHSKILKEYK